MKLNLFSGLLGGVAAVPQKNDNIPKAYLKYIIFDKNMKPQQNGHDVLGDMTENTWEELTLDIPIEHNGYIYIYACPPNGGSPTT